MDELFVGIMSGTSVNGVDTVVVNFAGNQIQPVAHYAEEYPADVYTALQDVIRTRQIQLSQLADLDQQLAIIYTLAVKKLLQQAGIASNRVRAIGCHGQTIYHQPEGRYHNTLQIGDPNFLAEHTGITVVADLRRRDMAAGGQGAPLAPALHHAMFRSNKVTRVIVNIGGIANLTLLPADAHGEVIGFDTGPGNTLMDLWIRAHRQQAYDREGAWAASGQADQRLLNLLLADAYFSRPLPKSTGREYFNLEWLQQKIKVDDYRAEDIQATLLELTCASIAGDIIKHASACQEVYVCGGGAYNTQLLQRLQHMLGTRRVATTAELGLDPDKVEATAFAWLARQTLLGKPGNLNSVTGARQPVVLGAIYQGA